MKPYRYALALLTTLMLCAPPLAAEDEPAWGGRPMSHWLEQLNRGATGLGQAPEALVAIGKPAVEPLRQRLMGVNPSGRENAARVLGLMGGVAETSVPELAELMADDRPAVRAAAALALGRVARALETDSTSLDSVERLVDAAARLKERMDDPEVTVRTAVLQGMALMGGFSQDDLRQLLQDPKGRHVAFHAIAALGPEASELAVNLLKHPSWHVRQWTLRHLTRAQLDSRSWLPAVADATHDVSEAVAMEALQHLARRLGNNDEAATLAVRAFTSPHARVRAWAPRALVGAKRVGPAATRALLAAIQSEDPTSRQAAAWALGQSTSEREAVVAALTRTIGDKEKRPRWCAARSLVELGETPDAAMGPLREALLASHVKAPYEVILTSGLGKMVGSKRLEWLPQPDQAWPTLLRFGARGSAHLAKGMPKPGPERWTVIHAQAQFESAAVPPLRALLEDRDAETRRRAALTLATLEDESFACLASLLAALEEREAPKETDEPIEEEVIVDDAPVDWHETALAALKGLGPKAVPQALEHLAAARPDEQKRMQPGLRAWIVTVGKEAVPHLEALRADFELGAWIDGVVAAIEAKADAAKKKWKDPK